MHQRQNRHTQTCHSYTVTHKSRNER